MPGPRRGVARGPGVAAGTRLQREALIAKGFSESRADGLATARIFGTKPGHMSRTNILHLVPRSGVWENTQEIASVYVDTMSYVYAGDHRRRARPGAGADATLRGGPGHEPAGGAAQP